MATEIEEHPVESLSSTPNQLRVKDFVWIPEEWPTINHDDFSDENDVPVISLAGVRDRRDYSNLCRKMVAAGENWGFFKLVDHGVPSTTIENVKNRLNELFDLPMDRKLKGGRSKSLPLGYSATNPDYGLNLPWAEILQLLQSPQQVVEFAKRVFGDQHQAFSDAMIEYMQALDKLGMKILEMLAHGLGLDEDFFVKNFAEKESTMIRVNRYPPCPLPGKCLGLGSHSDPHTLTILVQDEVGGLQILKDDDDGGQQWIGIRPVPDSFVINFGDTLEAWTNGRLKSVVHRAVVNKEKQRLSLAYFLSPSSEITIESPPQLVDPLMNPKKYVPFTWGDFRNQLLIQKRVVGKTALARYLDDR